MTARVTFATAGSRIAQAFVAAAVIFLAAAPYWGVWDDLRLLTEIYAYVALASRGTCWPGMRGSSRSDSRPMWGWGAMCCLPLRYSQECRRSGRYRWPA